MNQSTVRQCSRFLAGDAGLGHIAEERLGGFVRDRNDGRGHDLDAVAVTANPNTKIQCSIRSIQCGVETAHLIPRLAPNEHSRFTDSENIAHTVILRLIEFVFRKVNRNTRAGHRLAELANEGGTVGVHLFGAHGTNGRAGVDDGTQIRKSRSSRNSVVAQNPDKAAVVVLKYSRDSIPHSARDSDGGVPNRDVNSPTGCVCHHDRVGHDGLCTQAFEYLAESFTRTPTYDNRGDGHGESPAGHKKCLGATAETAAFALGKPAPDAEPFVVFQSIFEAFALDRARAADALCIAGRSALFGEEGLGVGLRAECVCLPGQRVVVADSAVGNTGNAQRDGVNKPVLRNVVTVLSHWRCPVESVVLMVLITPVLFGFVKSDFSSRVADVRFTELQNELRKISALAGAQ